MASRSYFGKMNSTLGSVVPLAMFINRRRYIEGAIDLTSLYFRTSSSLHLIGQSGLGNAKVEEEEEKEEEEEEAEVVVLVGLKASTKQPRLKHPSSLDMRNKEAIT